MSGPNILEKNVIGVNRGSGVPETCHVAVDNPLPCIVILIHGVNDVGEAFPNLDNGICQGLNQRLGRCDLKANEWKVTGTEADSFAPRMSIVKEGYSPVIPFFWGYKPVDKDEYKKQQQDYKQRLEKQNEQDPELPYDSYWKTLNIDELSDKIKTNTLNCDKFGNWIDCHFQRNGGPFSDATTCIPDMYGPGMGGETAGIGKWGSSDGAKVYDNPHRIYLAFAAHRLATLIKEIRAKTDGQDIPINIVAHSQGTIITMLANMILDEEEILPADCAILAHSPYAFDISLMEQFSKDFGLGMQTPQAREQTFINFVQQISAGQARRKVHFNPEILLDKGVIGKPQNNDGEEFLLMNGDKQKYQRLGEHKELFYRDNFGKVYNYFSPNDHVVSLVSVQGIGWQGIPDDILEKCKNSRLKQRIFSQHYMVGYEPKVTEVNIPIVVYHITSKEYPIGISEQDFRQRVTTKYYHGGNYQPPVFLSTAQIEILKMSPLFKHREGKIVSAHYLESGRSISVQYRPSFAEFEQENPLAVYHQVTAQDLTDECINTEQQKNKNDPDIEERQKALDQYSPMASPISALEAKALLNCQSVSTSGLQTVRYNATRRVTGEAVPQPFIYQVDEPGKKTDLSRVIHFNDAYHSDKLAKLKQELFTNTIPTPDWMMRPSQDEWRNVANNGAVHVEVQDKTQLERLAQEQGWDRGLVKAEHIGIYIPNDRIGTSHYQLLITRYLTHAELQTKITELVESIKDESSHHSGITMNELAPKQVMAYDLALGIVKGITVKNLSLLQSWRNTADWRSMANLDPDALEYMKTGKLPKKLKEAMGYPNKGHMPKTVINDFYSVTYTAVGTDMQQQELDKAKYRLLSSWPKVQYPLPEPDLITE